MTIPPLQNHGVLTQVAGHNIDIIKLIPPLMIDKKDVDYFMSSFKVVMESLHKFPGSCWEVISRIAKATFPNTPDINHSTPSEGVSGIILSRFRTFITHIKIIPTSLLQLANDIL